MTATPPNLHSLFGAAFRIGHDPAAVTAAERKDPWLMTLPCENGVTYPHGVNRLAIECKGANAAKLIDLAGVKVHQHGNSEWALLFDLAMFDAVAAIVKPRRKAQMVSGKEAGHGGACFQVQKARSRSPRIVERGIGSGVA